MSENTEETNEKAKPFQVNDIQPGPGLKIGGIGNYWGDDQEVDSDGDTPIINAE